MKKRITIMCIFGISLCSCHTQRIYNFDSIYEYVIDLGTFNINDWSYCTKHYYDYTSTGKKGCSAIYKNIGVDDLVARNMDITLSENPVIIYRTDNMEYKTLNLAYSGFTSYAYKNMIKNGVDNNYLKIMPGFTTDSMNEEGLYISINMREREFDEHGNVKWTCLSTNKDSSMKILNFALAPYLTERCKSIEEALLEIQHIDMVNPDTSTWNAAYTMVDSTGRHGVLEIVDNKAIFNENVCVNTNSYICPEYRENAKYMTGLGREEYLKENIDEVTDTNGMLSLISDVIASKIYTTPNECKFDIRNDYLDSEIGWDTAYVTDEANQEEVLNEIDSYSSFISSLTHEERMACGEYWMSIIHY